MRTPIRKRELPDYTKREELLNVFTHIAGAVLAAAVLVLSLLKSTAKGNAWGVVSTAIYGASMMMVFREHICYSIRIDIDFTTFYRLLVFLKK